jgi:L-asparaginase II
VEVERSGFVESRHRGVVCGLDASGTEVVRIGATSTPIFPRSANKPLQALAMARNGLDLDGELLALASASHSGQDFHIAGVEKILAGAGLTADALRCPAHWPLDDASRHELVRAGGAPSRTAMNCSGKHAAMLATCVINDWPIESYRAADHPLQLAIRETAEELAGERVAATGVDGCGAALFALTPRGVARAFRALVLGEPGGHERRIADAMRAHPEWTSGTVRDEFVLMRAVPGLLLKAGAEGVDAFALADGRAGVVKIDDGAKRARTPVTVALLRALGVDGTAELDRLATAPLPGGDETVGIIRPASGLLSHLP